MKYIVAGLTAAVLSLSFAMNVVAEEAEKKAEEAKEEAPAENTADGEKVYKGLCFSCHDNGIAGAPKVGDAEAWKPLIEKGMEELYKTSLEGKGAMPAKGGNPALSDDEVKAAVDYMVEQSKGEKSE